MTGCWQEKSAECPAEGSSTGFSGFIHRKRPYRRTGSEGGRYGDAELKAV
jgi:hypothetical protein